MHHPTDRIAHTTAFVTPVVEHWLERVFNKRVHVIINTVTRNYFHQLNRTQHKFVNI